MKSGMDSPLPRLLTLSVLPGMAQLAEEFTLSDFPLNFI